MKKFYTTVLSVLISVGAFAQDINTNGDFETGDLTGWNAPAGAVTYEVNDADVKNGSYSFHVLVPAGSKVDGLATTFDFEIGKTYTVQMWVKASEMSDNIAMRLMPATGWNDSFKDYLTPPGTTWGTATVIGDWVFAQFTKEITTDFLAGSSLGDVVASKLHLQQAGTNAMELYIDDVSIYVGQPTAINDAVTADEIQLQIYPNPASGEVSVFVSEMSDLIIVDMSGKQVKSLAGVNENTSVDLSDVKPGIYFVIVDNGVNKTTEKLLVK